MQEKLELVRKSIRSIPDFPQKGILFRDVTTTLLNPESFNASIDLMIDKVEGMSFNYVAGIEARGFIFGAVLAKHFGVGFIPVRKKGKLPCETHEVTYNLEYGTSTLEIDRDAVSSGDQVLIVDDLLATGGTVLATKELIEKCGAQVEHSLFLIDLPELPGGKKLKSNNLSFDAIVSFEGH